MNSNFHQKVSAVVSALASAVLIIFFAFFASDLSAQSKYLETIKVTDSIYVFKPKIDWVHGNGTAVIGPDGVFFIDTYLQTNYAEEAIRLLGQITKLPVKFVLNTHFHNDHVMGNYIFKRTFPGCQIIAHDSTYKYMNGKIKVDISTEMKDNDDGIAQVEQELKDGKTSKGVMLTSSMKGFWEWQLREGKEYKESYKGNQFVNADITFSKGLNFHWGGQTIQLIYMSDNGHSPGDVIAWVPEKRILIAGDLVVGPTPYATHDNVPGMVKAIQKIIDMDPSIIIPGHGPIEYDLEYVKLVKDAFNGYIDEAEKDIENKIPVKDAMKNAALPDLDKRFTGDDDVKKWAYESFFSHFVIYYTYKAKGALKK